MKIFAEKVLGETVGMLFAICPLSEAMYNPRRSRHHPMDTPLWE